MTAKWECEQSFVTRAPRNIAWAYWSDMTNHAEMEGVSIELDGPFRTGTKGRTITPHSRQEWELRDVIRERRFATVGREAGFELSFAWDFADEGTGTRMTQVIGASGTEAQMEKWGAALRQMEIDAPKGMQRLAAKLDNLGN